jgi:hypothetical protein
MMAEMPVAQVSKLLVQINSDPKKSKPVSLKDFLLFSEKDKEKVFPAEAAAVCLHLRMEKQLPEEFVAVWPAIKEGAKKNTKTPEIRAMKSDCGNIWAITPSFKDGKMQGVMLVKNFVRGIITLRDIDKELYTIEVEVPARNDFCYIEECSFKLADIKTLIQ